MNCSPAMTLASAPEVTLLETIGEDFPPLRDLRMRHTDGLEVVSLMVVEETDEGLRRATNFDLEYLVYEGLGFFLHELGRRAPVLSRPPPRRDSEVGSVPRKVRGTRTGNGSRRTDRRARGQRRPPHRGEWRRGDRSGRDREADPRARRTWASPR